MNRQQSKLNQEHAEETTSQQQVHQETQALEFQHADEMIRHDAAHTDAPASLAGRLQESIAREPAPPRPWWRGWMGQPS